MDERIDFGMSDPDLVPLIIQVWNTDDNPFYKCYFFNVSLLSCDYYKFLSNILCTSYSVFILTVVCVTAYLKAGMLACIRIKWCLLRILKGISSFCCYIFIFAK